MGLFQTFINQEQNDFFVLTIDFVYKKKAEIERISKVLRCRKLYIQIF